MSIQIVFFLFLNKNRCYVYCTHYVHLNEMLPTSITKKYENLEKYCHISMKHISLI